MMWLNVLLFVTIFGVVYGQGGCNPRCTIEKVPKYFFTVTRRGTNTLAREYNASAILGPGIGTYTYRGRSYDHIAVSVNGMVTFGDKVVPFTHPDIDEYDRYDIAAAFWAETDTALCKESEVYYRHSTHKGDRRRFKKRVKAAGGPRRFKPDHVIVVTYLNVDDYFWPCCSFPEEEESDFDSEKYAAQKEEVRPRMNRDNVEPAGLNTYQIVLGTKRVSPGGEWQTYVILNYATVCWTDSPASMAGFYEKTHGDRYQYSESFTPHVVQVTEDGNVSPGVFRVDRTSGITAPNRNSIRYVHDKV